MTLTVLDPKTGKLVTIVVAEKRHQPRRGAYTCNEEPRLDELLGEDAVRLVMASDGWTKARIRMLAAWVRASRLKVAALEGIRADKADEPSRWSA